MLNFSVSLWTYYFGGAIDEIYSWDKYFIGSFRDPPVQEECHCLDRLLVPMSQRLCHLRRCQCRSLWRSVRNSRMGRDQVLPFRSQHRASVWASLPEMRERGYRGHCHRRHTVLNKPVESPVSGLPRDWGWFVMGTLSSGGFTENGRFGTLATESWERPACFFWVKPRMYILFWISCNLCGRENSWWLVFQPLASSRFTLFIIDSLPSLQISVLRRKGERESGSWKEARDFVELYPGRIDSWM